MIDRPVQGPGLLPSIQNIRRQESVPEVAKVSQRPDAVVGKSSEHTRAEASKSAANNALHQISTLEATLPIEILRSPVLMRTEWAWRRLLVELTIGKGEAQSNPETPLLPKELPRSTEGNHSVQAYQPTVQSPLPQASPPPLVEVAVKVMWQTLMSLTARPSQSDWNTQLPPPFEPGMVIPFTDMTVEHLSKNVPDKVKEWTEADRLVGSTRTPDAPQVGGGLFVLPESIGQRMNAVRWEAERRTRVTNQGQQVHQLILTVSVDNFPVKIQLLCAKPSLTVRLETNHPDLKQRVEPHLGDAQAALNGIGWRLDRWSLGDLGNSEEEGL